MEPEPISPIVIVMLILYLLMILAGIDLIVKEKRFGWGTTFIFVGVTPILLGLLTQIGIIKEKGGLFLTIVVIVTIYSFIIGNHQGNPASIATVEMAKE